MATDTRDINFATRYEKRLDQMLTHGSYAKASMGAKGEFKDVDGVQSVYFRNVDTSGMISGHTGPAFGTPDALASTPIRKDVEYFYQINTYMSAVDINDTAGALKEAGKIMQLALDEQYAPLVDKLAFGTAIAAATDYAGDNVVAYDATGVRLGIDKMIATLGQQRSTSQYQTLFLPWSVKPLLDDNLFTDFHPVKNDEVVNSGIVGRLFGVKTVVVPDELFVTITNTGTAPYAQATFTQDATTKAILWDNRVMANLAKMEQINVLTGEKAVIAGYDGAVLRGLFRPGAWVFDANGTKKGVAILSTSVSAASQTLQAAAPVSRFSAPVAETEPTAEPAIEDDSETARTEVETEAVEAEVAPVDEVKA